MIVIVRAARLIGAIVLGLGLGGAMLLRYSGDHGRSDHSPAHDAPSHYNHHDDRGDLPDHQDEQDGDDSRDPASAIPHADHATVHGGVLLMVGETHLEIVRHGEDIEIYLSDAYRRPMNAVGGRISFGDEPATSLVWNEDRLSAHDDPRFDVVTIQVRFPDGTDLDINATIAKRPAS